MANTQKYLNHLLQNTGITPACSEEERAAADIIAKTFADHGFTPQVQEFSASGSAKIVQAGLGIAVFLGAVLMGIGGIVGVIGLLLTVAAGVVFAMERGGRQVLSQLGNGGLSQNVIAYHKASGPLASPRNRPVVIVAHYDSPRADLLCQEPFATYRPLLVKLLPYAMLAPAVIAVVRLLPLPGAAKIILWVLAIAAALIPLANAAAIIANRFVLPYTTGSVCNKSSVAALLGVMDAVSPYQGHGEEFPEDVPFDEYYAEQRRVAEEAAAAAAAALAAESAYPHEAAEGEEGVGENPTDIPATSAPATEGAVPSEEPPATPEEPAPSAIDEPPAADETAAFSVEEAAPQPESTVALGSTDVMDASAFAAGVADAVDGVAQPQGDGAAVDVADQQADEPTPKDAEPAEDSASSPLNAEGNYRFGAEAIRNLGMLSDSCALVYESDDEGEDEEADEPTAFDVQPDESVRGDESEDDETPAEDDSFAPDVAEAEYEPIDVAAEDVEETPYREDGADDASAVGEPFADDADDDEFTAQPVMDFSGPMLETARDSEPASEPVSAVPEPTVSKRPQGVPEEAPARAAANEPAPTPAPAAATADDMGATQLFQQPPADVAGDPSHTVAMPARPDSTVDRLMAEISVPAPKPARAPQVRSIHVPSTADAPVPHMPETANRASLFDLPDPSAAPVDPFVSPDAHPAASSSDTAVAARSAFTVISSDSAAPAPVPAQPGQTPPVSSRIETISAPAPEQEQPRHGLGRLFGRKKKKTDSMSDWLGVDEGFDAKTSGGDIGSWDNFEDDDSGWKGGATGPEGASEAELREAVTSMGDDELLGHDIWFVATGSSENGNAGIHAFLREHRDKLRGVFLINLECVGAGQIAMLATEGEQRVLKGDKRIMKLVGRVSADFHHEFGAVDMPYVTTDAHAAMSMSLRSLTLGGVEGTGFALGHTEEDQPYNVDADNIALVSDVVTEVIRRS